MRVMIAEDSGLLRHLLTGVLTAHGWSVTGAVGTADELLCLVDSDPPDMVVLDIRMPPYHRDEGLQAACRIRRRHPGVGLLVLSHYAETSYAVRLLEHADHSVGYLVKDRVQDVPRLMEALDRVAAGEVVIDPEVVRAVMNRRRLVDPLAHLTPSERDVLALMAEGLANATIAARLHHSQKTVEKRVTAICQKLGLSNQQHDRAAVNVRVLAVLAYLRSTGSGTSSTTE